MAKQDWIGILVPSEDCTEIYKRIFNELKIDFIETEKSGWPQVNTQRAADATKKTDRKPW